MIELAQHIETLLIDNDCVIIPGFGGFVAHHSKARWVKEENLFLPPTRTIGFNPQLKLNDGLLVQSYMKVYDTDFSDASKRVEKAVEELVDTLHKEGQIEIHGVGEMSLTIHNTYEFRPNEDGILTPELYGLSSFEIQTLADLRAISVPETEPEKVLIPRKKTHKNVYEIKINRSLLRNTVAIAAAVLLFFFLSTPLENTYVAEDSYAELISTDLFDTIKDQSVAMTLVHKKQATPKNKRQNLKPKAVKVEKVCMSATAAKEKTAAKPATIAQTKNVTTQESQIKRADSNKKYNIIIASVGKTKDAQRMSESLKSKGFSDACVIERDGKIRVSLASYSNQTEAYNQLKQIRQNQTYKDAWLLTNK